MGDFTKREHLIERLLHLPPRALSEVERFFDCLDHEYDSSKRSDSVGRQIVESAPNPLEHHSVRDWPHAPLHRLADHGTYIVTAGTMRKEHFFRGAKRLDLLESALLSNAMNAGWQLEAWAVFSNHYHFVAHASATCDDLQSMLKNLHGRTATELNRLDRVRGRQVWFNFRETELTYEKSYYARLSYVHHNAVKHGLVPVANQYRWCSAAWFERTAPPAQVRTVYSFRTGKIKIADDFEPVAP